MKFLKWLFFGLIGLFLTVGVGVAALVYLVDWNDFKETIQNQTKTHTGRDLTIAGDLNPTFFPWVGISIGDIELANAEGFGDKPFAKMGSADVKVEVLPLLKKVVNIRTVELQGLALDLQRAADGSTNWDDLVNSTTTTTTENTEDKTEVEVEGGTAAIAALAVGGISVTGAEVSWMDAQSGTDAQLSNFNLTTGAIELATPFDLATDFDLASNSMGLAAGVDGKAQVMIDLEKQSYALNNLVLNTSAKGDTLPNGALDATLGASITAQLEQQQVQVESLSLDALGVQLNGAVDVTDLDTVPNINANLNSNEFSLLDLFAKLGIAAPVTADPDVLKKASLSLALSATPSAAALNDLTIKLDDTTFNGNAEVPSLAGGIPPVRFDFAVDAIDIDRYLPPKTDADQSAQTGTANDAGTAATGDEPIALPMELLRQLDVNGDFRVGSVKVSNLTTRDIVVPVRAKAGVLALDGLKASLYEGQFNGKVALDAVRDTPNFTVDMNLDGIEADPLLADLMQKDSFLSGKGRFAANLATSGNTVNGLTSALNGTFNSAFNDGSINGINLGYQIRRAKAALGGQKLSATEEQVKTDFSELSVSGTFTNGVMQSDDLDMRSPLLRVGGAGEVDLPAENVDYTLTTLITGSSQGQGGKDLESLKGVKLDIPIQASFAELAENFAGVILAGMKNNIANNLKGQAEAKARAAAEKAKAKAQAALEKKEAEARAKLAAQEDKARAKLAEEKAEAQKKLDEAAKQGADKLKGKLKGLLK